MARFHRFGHVLIDGEGGELFSLRDGVRPLRTKMQPRLVTLLARLARAGAAGMMKNELPHQDSAIRADLYYLGRALSGLGEEAPPAIAEVKKNLRAKAAINLFVGYDEIEDEAAKTLLSGPRADAPVVPWQRINHSDPGIQYSAPEPEIAAAIGRIVTTQYRKALGSVREIQCIVEDTGSRNYRVVTERAGCVLIRWQRFELAREDDERKRWERVLSIHRQIADAEVFTEGDALRPIESDRGSPIVTDETSFVFAFPYVEGVVHYPGDEHALMSVAGGFGRVQKQIAGLPQGDDPVAATSPDWLASGWSQFVQVHEKSRVEWEQGEVKGDALRAYYQHRWRIHEAAREAYLFPTPQVGDGPAQYNGFHPHNAFFRGTACVLIYDYDTVSVRWPVHEPLAVAIHRTVRETLRHRLHGGDAFAERDIPRLVTIFLQNYQRAGGFVPDRFLDHFPAALRRIMLMKLVSVMAFLMRLRRDPSGRGTGTLRSEVRKFIMFLLEADIIEEWLRKPADLRTAADLDGREGQTP